MTWNARPGREQVENTSSLVQYGGYKPSVYVCVFSGRDLSAVRRERLCTRVHKCGLKVFYFIWITNGVKGNIFAPPNYYYFLNPEKNPFAE